VPIYENLVVGNFLFALGLQIGAHRADGSPPGLGVHLLQQTPLDMVLGDVLLAGPRSVALLEFKRAADRRLKERDKLLKLNALLEHPSFQTLRDTSRNMHFYIETRDVLDAGFSRVLPYLDLTMGGGGSSLEEFISDMVSRATCSRALVEAQIVACQRYLELVCVCQGRTYNPSPGLLLGVDGDGRIAFAPVDDVRDLRSTFAAIRDRDIARHQDIIRVRARELMRDRSLGIRLER
jgi:hypothetical protein